MMAKAPPLGPKQLGFLAGMCHVASAVVVPDSLTDSLVRRGLMEPTGTTPKSANAFVVVTAAGYRAIADAIDAGRLPYKPDFNAIRAKNGALSAAFGAALSHEEKRG